MTVDLTSTTFVDELGDGGLRWVAPGDEWVSNGKVFDIFLWNLKIPQRDPLVGENSFQDSNTESYKINNNSSKS